MAHIMNMDRVVNPRPVTFISPVDGLERGIFVEIEGMAANNLWQAGADDFEAYKVKVAGASTEVENLLIHTTVPKQYEENKIEADFVANQNAVCRGHYITTGDEYTLPVDFVGGSLAVGAEVGLVANGKLAVNAENKIGEVVKVYNWNGQPSVMIRFY